MVCSSSHLVADEVTRVFNIRSLLQYPRNDFLSCFSYCVFSDVDARGIQHWHGR